MGSNMSVPGSSSNIITTKLPINDAAVDLTAVPGKSTSKPVIKNDQVLSFFVFFSKTNNLF